jgi:FtsP/CotA-like multicopper oxidase with cupredoxin domain
LSRQKFDTKNYTTAYAAAFPAGFDFTMHMDAGPGAFIPAFGPPLNYANGNTRALGGNPDITPFLKGPLMPPLPQEYGWKDTVMMLPGQVTRFIIRWALQNVPNGEIQALPFDPRAGNAGYVWHCHIVDHEDNEMMRPDEIEPIPDATRTYNLGQEY